MPTPAPTRTISAAVVPRERSAAASKPERGHATVFLVNSNDQEQIYLVNLANTTLPDSRGVTVSPNSVTLLPGEAREIAVDITSTLLQPGEYSLHFGVDVRMLDSLPVSLPFSVEFTVTAAADASTTTVQVDGAPVIGTTWSGLKITPCDSDGFALGTDSSEDFAVSLEKSLDDEMLAAACTTTWAAPALTTECIVPDANSRAGDWNLAVTLRGEAIHTESLPA